MSATIKQARAILSATAGNKRRYAVVLHNDALNTKRHVISALTTAVPDMQAAEAAYVTYRAHNTGQSIVRICEEDVAMRYCADLARNQLDITMEPGW
jgi:ATP-dependent Clp protease adapter protein ClpS